MERNPPTWSLAAYEESRVDLAQAPRSAVPDSAHGHHTPGPRPVTPVMSRPFSEPPGPGSVLGPYRLLEQVSAGRSAVVFRAWHARLPVPVAVKVLLADEPVDRAYLRNEAAVLAWVHHPNIVRLWDFDEDGPFPFLVTEFAEGQTLGRFIEQHGRLDPRWVMQVVYFVAQGLLAASDVGVIHRDVKPANILILSSGQVKVCDFGLATVTSQQLRGVTPVPPAGGLLGTPAYVAPEQARDPQRVDARTDIYSLGATAWHALTGRLPFDGRSCLEVVYKHINELPVPPVRLVPSLPSAISDLVLKMMAPRPQDRPQSFAELLRALAECLR